MNDGGPAFPQPQFDDLNYKEAWDRGMGGMSLRAWYKGLAMQAWIRVLASRRDELGYHDDDVAVEATWYAARCADAMIKEDE